MAQIKFLKGTNVTTVDTGSGLHPALVDGQLIFDTATGKIYLDSATKRQLLYAEMDKSIKNALYEDSTLKLFYADTTPTAGSTGDIEINLPAEQFLDTNKTALEDNFAWSIAKYPDTTDPNLNGKHVLVLAMKKEDNTTAYSFMNVESLIDSGKKANMIEKAADGTTAIAAANEDEIVTVKYDGTKALGDIKTSGKKIGTSVRATASADDVTVPTEKAVRTELDLKANKVDGGTDGNLVKLDENGDIQDAGVATTKTVAAADTAADTNIPTEKAVRTELDKMVVAPTTTVDEHLVQFDETKGQIKDGGLAVTTTIDAAVASTLNTKLPTEKAVRTELDKKINRVAEDNSKEDEILLADDKGYAKTANKKITTTVRPATLTQDDIDDGKTVENDTAHDNVIPTEKAVRTAITEAVGSSVGGALTWGTF